MQEVLWQGQERALQCKKASVQPKAHLAHCHSHRLSLTVKDMTKGLKLLSDAMNITYKPCKLIKFSPKMKASLLKLKTT